jgi:sulfatase maturation enzyme AslB (radical SAM superfamily)
MTDTAYSDRPNNTLFPKLKFSDPDWTINGEQRASVSLRHLETFWINTGSLCNIECVNCYIESSPLNDRLAYITAREVSDFFDEINTLDLGTHEIGFTGGEPFMNPDIMVMIEDALTRGFDVLVLTNAMRPLQRPRIMKKLLELRQQFGAKLSLRISLDHYTQKLHEIERGPRSWQIAIAGIDWLSENNFKISVAGRTCWNENEDSGRQGYEKLFKARNYAIDSNDPGALVLFPEMDEMANVPEITQACWGILNVSPNNIMCSFSRMAVKRKGENRLSIVPCTLLPYDRSFDMGETLAASLDTDGGTFKDGAVKLNHPHCAKFCVLGGGKCSAGD